MRSTPDVHIGSVRPPHLIKNLPPAAQLAYAAANDRRSAEMNRLRKALPAGTKSTSRPGGFVAVHQPAPNLSVTAKHSPKGSETPMPAATATKRESTQSRYIVPMPTLAMTNLKSFASPESAFRAGMALLAGIGRQFGNGPATPSQFCRERGLQVFNTASTGDPQKGGYATGDEISQSLLVSMGRYGKARSIGTFVPMDGGRISIPVETAGPVVQVVSEMGALTPSDATWGAVAVEAGKRAVLSYISSEWADDALVSGVDTTVDAQARALARVEDRELVLAGDGLLASLAAGGIVDAAAGHDSWAELDMTDFANLIARLPEEFADGSESFICSSGFYGFMLKAAGGAAQGVAPDGTPLFLGKKVHLLAAMPATSAAATLSCLYGNWQQSIVFGDRGLRFLLSDQCPEVFEKDLIALRTISRYGIVVRNGGTASAAGSFVGLKTAAS